MPGSENNRSESEIPDGQELWISMMKRLFRLSERVSFELGEVSEACPAV